MQVTYTYVLYRGQVIHKHAFCYEDIQHTGLSGSSLTLYITVKTKATNWHHNLVNKLSQPITYTRKMTHSLKRIFFHFSMDHLQDKKTQDWYHHQWTGQQVKHSTTPSKSCIHTSLDLCSFQGISKQFQLMIFTM